MAISLVKKVFEFLLAKEDQRFTTKEIASWICEVYPDEYRKKLEQSESLQTEEDLVQQIASEISAQRKRLQDKHPIKITGDRPQKYYYTQRSEAEEVVEAEAKLKEHDLYPLLSKYLWDEFSLYSKRIDEKHSSNKQGSKGNKWLHPDLVALEDLSVEWVQEVKDCVTAYADKRTKLWSFEVKILINRSNVRECFFQAVANSSWANFGYLVASGIEGRGTIQELHMLSSAYGIGFILLDLDNLAESQILIPAKERLEISWDVANRLTAENKDFMNFIKLVGHYQKTGSIDASWDHVPGDDKAQDRIP